MTPQDLGNAAVLLYQSSGKTAAAPLLSYSMKGTLSVSKSGWILLSVPNALGNGAFQALHEPGIEQPSSESHGRYHAHISVMRPDEIESLGGPDAIKERGQTFSFSLGPVREIKNPNGQTDLSSVWVIEVTSPELMRLRKSYNLGEPKFKFHITFAQRKKNALITKRASVIHFGRSEKAAVDPSRTRAIMPYGEGYLMERMNNPKYPDNLGKQRFPGGGVDPGEDSSAAIMRELMEELSLRVKKKQLQSLGHHQGDFGPEEYFQVNNHGLSPGNYVANIGGDKNIELIEGSTADPNYWGASLDQLQKQAEVTNPALTRLLQAKAESDRGNYAAKHKILQELIAENPEAFIVDQEAHHPGLTHTPTGFRMHAPQRLAAKVRADQGSLGDQMLKAAFIKQAATNVEIRKSSVQGKGLFATSPLQDGDTILPQFMTKRAEDVVGKTTPFSPQKQVEKLLHYSRNTYPELRPLSYEELLKSRTSGSWANKPELAAEYVKDRKRFERELHRRLKARGIETDPNNTFLYATLQGKEQFDMKNQLIPHTVDLSDDLVNQSFFDVVGDGRNRTVFGRKGLQEALKRWQKVNDVGKLEEYEYMGMKINPRIEVITGAKVTPDALGKQAAAAQAGKSTKEHGFASQDPDTLGDQMLKAAFIKQAATNVEIRKSSVQGKGLFATSPFQDGDTILSQFMTKQPGEAGQIRWEQSENARYTNHSDKPNVEVVRAGGYVSLVASRDIVVGEELVGNYNQTSARLGPGFYYTYQGRRYEGGPDPEPGDDKEDSSRFGLSDKNAAAASIVVCTHSATPTEPRILQRTVGDALYKLAGTYDTSGNNTKWLAPSNSARPTTVYGILCLSNDRSSSLQSGCFGTFRDHELLVKQGTDLVQQIATQVNPPSNSFYRNAINQTPVRWNKSQGVGSNLLNHVSDVKLRGDRAINEAHSYDRLQNAMNPDRSAEQLMSYISGDRQPIVNHPLDRFIQGER